MKKGLVAGIAAVALVVGGGAAIALTATPPAPTPSSTSSATPGASDPAAIETPAPTATDDAAAADFLAMVKSNWGAQELPADADLIAAGQTICDELGPERGFDYETVSDWGAEADVVVYVAATDHLCPAG